MSSKWTKVPDLDLIREIDELDQRSKRERQLNDISHAVSKISLSDEKVNVLKGANGGIIIPATPADADEIQRRLRAKEIPVVPPYIRGQAESIISRINLYTGAHKVINSRLTHVPFKVAKGKQLSGIPDLKTSTNTRRWYRFVASSGSANTVTVGDVLGAMGTIGIVTNTSVETMHSAMKISAVRAWTSPQSSDAVSINFSWLSPSGNAPDDEKVSSVIPFTSGLGYLSDRPPKQSFASFWWNGTASSTNLFTVSLPIGSFIDILVQGRLANEFSDLIISVATATASHTYYLALDGPTTNNLVPVGLPTTH
jgi:hypothetical protein